MFETMLYIVAIVAVLAFFGEPRHTTTEETTAPATEATAKPEAEPATEAQRYTRRNIPTRVQGGKPEPAADLSSLSVTELRRRATAARYPWRNHHGPNRHATKRELIAALT